MVERSLRMRESRFDSPRLHLLILYYFHFTLTLSLLFFPDSWADWFAELDLDQAGSARFVLIGLRAPSPVREPISPSQFAASSSRAPSTSNRHTPRRRPSPSSSPAAVVSASAAALP
jgi:hypothetical protein